MARKLLIFLVLLLAVGVSAYAQSGALKGKVTDKSTKEPIPFASVIVLNNNSMVAGGTTDIDGNFMIKPITPGKYDVKGTFVGYKPVLVTGIPIRNEKIEFLDIEMEASATQITGVEVIGYKVPLIDKDKTVSGGTVTSEEIAKMPTRSASAVATSVGGVFSRDGEVGSVRGQRTDGNVTYVDGIRVRGLANLPESAIEQVQVILGGVPAQYGDATGGIINITTRGPSRQFGGGLELQTSQFLDPFGSHRVGVNFTGPLFINKKTNEALLGYFIAADFNYHKDGATLPLGLYKAKDSVLRAIELNPLRNSTTGFGTYQNVEFLRRNDLEEIKTSLNSAGYDISTSGKLDIKTGNNSNLTFGGTYNLSAGKNFDWGNSIFNYDRNSYTESNTLRIFGRFIQRFPDSKDSKSLIKNIFYSIQADYTSIYTRTEDADLKDNLFAYGNIGKFNTFKQRGYDVVLDTAGAANNLFLVMNGYADTLVTFERSEFNPILANYTDNFYDLMYDAYGFVPTQRDQIYAGGGLLNGFNANGVFGGVYSLWSSPGNQQAGYGVNTQNQITANLNFSADVGNHEIRVGFTFEKLSQSNYGYAPTAFWPQMYQLTNAHIVQLDLNNPSTVPLGEVMFQGASYEGYQTDYGRLYDANSQRIFDMNLREAMGLQLNGTDWIDIDSYDLNSNTISYIDANDQRHTVALNRPLSVDFFSPDELLNNGAQIAAARGYDYYGNKLTSKPSVMDFYNKYIEKEVNGDSVRIYSREIAPFEPIYMAFYASDRFSFDDLVFNVGVRVDRFDANQSTLADPYSLYPIRTVAEVRNSNPSFTHPEGMGDDYAVYVDNSDNISRIMGYRSGSNWFDANGSVVPDPNLLDAGNGIDPYFVNDKDDRIITEKSFSDYEPQITVMPRIAFSFPISDEALFYAHYDVITQRPRSNVVFNPTSYLFWESQGVPTISNPNLKPERNVNYELGFQQKLSNTSSLNISAYYNESRDQIQAYRFSGAFPTTYYSYSNIDFSTSKGLTVTYDLRRTGNVRLRASYTLAFANGTGSNQETSSALIRSGQPNLRNLVPLDFDQRHAFQINVDFRFSEGNEYNGPVLGGKRIFENAGFNITMNGGSGTPYTRSSYISPLGQTNVILGSWNGSRLPGYFRMDGRLDKDFTLSTKKDEKGNRKSYYMNVFLQVLNILNARNIQGVYPATGNADDDGYLAAAEWQNEINSQISPESYKDFYRIRVNNPYFLSSPRMIRIGLSLNF